MGKLDVSFLQIPITVHYSIRFSLKKTGHCFLMDHTNKFL